MYQFDYNNPRSLVRLQKGQKYSVYDDTILYHLLYVGSTVLDEELLLCFEFPDNQLLIAYVFVNYHCGIIEFSLRTKKIVKFDEVKVYEA